MSGSYLQSLLSDREKIILISRQHWFLLLSTIYLEIVIILVIFAICTGLSIALSASSPAAIPIIVAVGFIVLFFPLATMTRDILVWSNYMFVITNRRVMQISGIYNKNIIDSSLEKVNDVKMQQSAFGRIFNYGDVEILTASELAVNRFSKVEDPVGFKTAMLNAKDQLEHGDDRPEPLTSPALESPPTAIPTPKQASAMDVPNLITQLAQLRQQGYITEEEFITKKAELLKKI
jgi:uncharacterized membrane protein YdbT with pleckstrin-like domain